MSMVTKCPACDTVFRVTPGQLQAQEGKVRCGRCMTVFDGFKGLATLPDQTAVESQERAPADTAAPLPLAVVENKTAAVPPETGVAQDWDATEPATGKAQLFELESPPGFPEFTLQPASPQQPELEPQPEPRAEAPDGAEEAQPAAAAADLASEAAPAMVARHPLASKEPLYAKVAEAGPRHSSWTWAAGSLVLLFVLAAQAAYVYRSELASGYPGLRPVLTQMCETLECDVPLPQRPKLINVEASDLQVVDPAHPSMIQLTATLRNHAGYDLAYPALDLVLTNSREHTLARRIFLPREYIERGKNVKAGIAASAEITIRLDLDTGNLGATGFRLGLLPAPAQ